MTTSTPRPQLTKPDLQTQPAPVSAGDGAASTPTGAKAPNRRGRQSGALAGRVAVIGGFVAMVVFFSVLEPDTFLSHAALISILDQSAVPMILVAGLSFVLVVGEFDLSYTSTIGVAGGIAIVLMSKHGWSIGAAIGITLLASLAIGVVVGVLVTLGRASSFIVTLAIGSAVTGLEQALTGNATIYTKIPKGYNKLAIHEFLGLKNPVWLALIILIVTAVLLHGTRFGRQAKAIGGNPAAAYLAGVRVRRIKIAAFVLVAFGAGIAAIILSSRAASYYPNASAGILLNTYAAAFLGAAIGARSSFTILGSAIGVLWIVTLQTGLTLHNEPAWTTNLIQGVVLAVAVLIAARGKRTGA